MSDESIKALDFDTVMCFVHGLIEVAKVDGIQPKERDYIEGFLNEELALMNSQEKMVFEDLIKDTFDRKKVKELITDNELKEFFLKSCVMLACVDNFSDEERALIREFADDINYSQENLDKIINEVQTEIMAHFKDITIYSDSLKDVAQSIGVKNF